MGNSLVVREPVGVVGAITPWNYPLHQIVDKTAPALAAGNCVVLKPSEVTPLDAFILAEIIDSAGLPAGVFNLVTGTGPVVGEAIASHPDVDMVSFTGSTRAGKRVSELGAQTVKRVHLELGGKSANVILDDADLERGGARRRHLRLLPQLGPDLLGADPHARAPRQAGRGGGHRQGHRRGPHASAPARATPTSARSCRPPSAIGCAATSRRASTRGPRWSPVVSSAPEGLDKGYFVKPTIFADVTSDMTIAQEEIFGPVLVIMPYDSEDEAVEIANSTIYGLAGGVQSADLERAKAFARRLRTGQVEVNGGGFNIQAPFGGYKQSGQRPRAGQVRPRGVHRDQEHAAARLTPASLENGSDGVVARLARPR